MGQGRRAHRQPGGPGAGADLAAPRRGERPAARGPAERRLPRGGRADQPRHPSAAAGAPRRQPGPDRVPALQRQPAAAARRRPGRRDPEPELPGAHRRDHLHRRAAPERGADGGHRPLRLDGRGPADRQLPLRGQGLRPCGGLPVPARQGPGPLRAGLQARGDPAPRRGPGGFPLARRAHGAQPLARLLPERPGRGDPLPAR